MKYKYFYHFFSFLFVSLLNSAIVFAIQETPKGDGFALRHDAAIYGDFLDAQKIEDSPQTSGLVLHENFLFAAGPRHITVYDVSDPLHPKQAARVEGIGEGRQIAFFKNHLYVTARTSGLHIVDVSNPLHPRYCAHYDTMELATGICCAHDESAGRDVAYVCQRQFGTEFIDISDPEKPRHAGFVLSGEAQSVDCANGILYAGDWGSKELSVIDVRNLKNPKIVGSGVLDGLGDGVYVRDEFCYAATGPHKLHLEPSTGHGLDVFCVKNPEKPQLAGRFKFPAQAVHRFPDFWSVAVDSRKIAYVADSFNGIFILDVSDPAKIKGIAYSILPVCERTGNPDPVGAFAVGNGVIYAAGCSDGVYVIQTDVAKPIDVRNSESLPSLTSKVRPNAAQNAELLRDFTLFETVGQALAAAHWKENLVWLAEGAEGLKLLDISGETPRVLQSFSTNGFAYDVKIDGNRLFTAEGKAGAAVYEIQEDGTLHESGRMGVDKNRPVRQIVVPDAKHWVVTKSANSELTFFDISDAANPKQVFRDVIERGILYGRDLVDGLSPSQNIVCVAQGNGLIWYDFSGDVPSRRGIEFKGKVSFYNGGCWVGKQFFFFRGPGYFICDEPKTFDEEDAFPPFHRIEGLPGFGKAVYNEKCSKICFTDRREGILVFLDVRAPEAPQVKRRYEFHGHPDLAIFVSGRTLIPCGHFGLLIEKRAHF